MAPVFALLALPACFLVVAGALHLMLRPLRRIGDAHWTEQARRLHPVRLAAGGMVLTVPTSLALGLELLASPPSHWLLVAFLLGLAGGHLALWPLERHEHPDSRFVPFVRRLAPHLVGVLASWGAFTAAVLYSPESFGPASLACFAASIAVGWWVGARRRQAAVGGGDARPVPPVLAALVARLAQESGTRVREVVLFESRAAAAAADVLSGRLLFTTTLVGALPEPELAAVVAHELAHLREPRSVVGLRIAAGLWLHPWTFARAALHAFGHVGFGVLVLGSLALVFGAARLSRWLEYRADRSGYAVASDPAAFARALVTIHRLNLVPVRMERSTASHPDLCDRLTAAGMQPDFPDTAPAGTMHWVGGLFSGLMGILLGVVGMRIIHG